MYGISAVIIIGTNDVVDIPRYMLHGMERTNTVGRLTGSGPGKELRLLALALSLSLSPAQSSRWLLLGLPEINLRSRELARGKSFLRKLGEKGGGISHWG